MPSHCVSVTRPQITETNLRSAAELLILIGLFRFHHATARYRWLVKFLIGFMAIRIALMAHVMLYDPYAKNMATVVALVGLTFLLLLCISLIANRVAKELQFSKTGIYIVLAWLLSLLCGLINVFMVISEIWMLYLLCGLLLATFICLVIAATQAVVYR